MTPVRSNHHCGGGSARAGRCIGWSLAVVLGVALVALAGTAVWSGPQGGTVVGGQADIATPNPLTTIINQTSDRAIINWNGFSIDVNELVRFLQPGQSAVALNRVTGVDPSIILGQLVANGRVFLMNPNGVVFGAGSQVDVAGLIATTLDMNDADFMGGKISLTGKPGAPPAAVINRGQIKVADNGFVFLVAPGVRNEGLIIANLGKVLSSAPATRSRLTSPATASSTTRSAASSSSSSSLPTVRASAPPPATPAPSSPRAGRSPSPAMPRSRSSPP